MTIHHGRRHREGLAKIDREHEYEPAEAVSLVKSLASAKFDEAVELHVRTGLNVRHADEQLRGTIALPNGLGRDVRIAVFARREEISIMRLVGATDGFVQRPLRLVMTVGLDQERTEVAVDPSLHP